MWRLGRRFCAADLRPGRTARGRARTGRPRRALPSRERSVWGRRYPRRERGATSYYALPREADQKLELVFVRPQQRDRTERPATPSRVAQLRRDAQNDGVNLDARPENKPLVRLSAHPRGGAEGYTAFAIRLEDGGGRQPHLTGDRDLPRAATGRQTARGRCVGDVVVQRVEFNTDNWQPHLEHRSDREPVRGAAAN